MLTTEQVQKLKDAGDLIADVQIEMLNTERTYPEKDRSDWWRVLYKMRCDLNEFIYADKKRAELFPGPPCSG